MVIEYPHIVLQTGALVVTYNVQRTPYNVHRTPYLKAVKHHVEAIILADCEHVDGDPEGNQREERRDRHQQRPHLGAGARDRVRAYQHVAGVGRGACALVPPLRAFEVGPAYAVPAACAVVRVNECRGT